MPEPCPVRAHRNGKYWVARWTTSDGEERAKSLKGCRSAREAERRCWEIAADFAVEPGKRDARGAPTLKEWAERYPELRPELDERTMMLHRKTLAYLAGCLGDSRRLDRITPADADDWRLWLGKQTSTRGKLSAQTVASHIRNAKVIFKTAKRRRLIGSNPFDDLSGTAPKPSKDWRRVTLEDLERIMAACPSEPWRVLFALCRLAGLRKGEALRLTWADIDWKARRLRVWPEGDETTKQRAREVPVSPRLLAVLQGAWEIARDGELGPCTPIASADHHRTALKVLKAAGIGAYPKPYHTLRKCIEGEWMQIAPWPTVCSWLGHSAKVAAEHYLRPEAEEFERVAGVKPREEQTA